MFMSCIHSTKKLNSLYTERESRRVISDRYWHIQESKRYPDGCVPVTWIIGLRFPYEKSKPNFGGGVHQQHLPELMSILSDETPHRKAVGL
jgi:hypothetical protein